MAATKKRPEAPEAQSTLDSSRPLLPPPPSSPPLNASTSAPAAQLGALRQEGSAWWGALERSERGAGAPARRAAAAKKPRLAVSQAALLESPIAVT